MEQKKLMQLRKERGFSQREIAKNISMEQATYSRKEHGISPITKDEWHRIANFLSVEVEDIKEDDKLTMSNQNCTFNEHSVGIQYVNIPQDVLDMMLRYTKKLEEENEKLQQKKG
jgi:transcriptional regulator with XRE-family HTH domain